MQVSMLALDLLFLPVPGGKRLQGNLAPTGAVLVVCII